MELIHQTNIKDGNHQLNISSNGFGFGGEVDERREGSDGQQSFHSFYNQNDQLFDISSAVFDKSQQNNEAQSGYSLNQKHAKQNVQQLTSQTGQNNKNANRSAALADDKIKLSFDHILSDIGIGNYQYLFYFVMAMLGLTEGAQVSVFTIMIPVLKAEWNVSEFANSLQVCLVFLGFLVGSMLSGQFADRYGRRRPFIYSSFFTVIFTLLSATTSNITQMVITRTIAAVLVGFFGPLGVTLLAEVTPISCRGRFMSLVTLSFSLGQLYGQLVGYFTLDSLSSGNWRALIFWTGLPGIIAWFVAIIYLDESARFSIIDGNFDQGFTIMAKMNQMNGNQLNSPDMSLSETDKAHLKNWSRDLNSTGIGHGSKGNISMLFEGEGKLITPLVWINWFSLSFIYYGIVVLMPTTMDLLMKLQHTQKQETAANDMVQLALSTFSEMVSASIASFLIEIKGLGRKNSLIICFILTGISSFIVFHDGKEHFVLWASVCKFFLSMTFIFSYQFTAEVYTTKIRTTGIGMANGIGRSGGSIMPWASQYLMKINIFAPFLLFTCLSFATALVDFTLPFDTLGRELDAVQAVNGENQEEAQLTPAAAIAAAEYSDQTILPPSHEFKEAAEKYNEARKH